MNGPIAVSDHALVRWIQRTGLVDLEPIRGAIQQSISHAAAAAEEIGGGSYLILADGLIYVIRDATLVTVIEEDSRHSHVWALSKREGDGAPGA